MVFGPSTKIVEANRHRTSDWIADITGEGNNLMEGCCNE